MFAALPTDDGHEPRRPGEQPVAKLSAAKLSAAQMQRRRHATREYAEESSAH